MHRFAGHNFSSSFDSLMSKRTSVTPVYENEKEVDISTVMSVEAKGAQDSFHVFHMRKTQLTNTCTDSTVFEA